MNFQENRIASNGPQAMRFPVFLSSLTAQMPAGAETLRQQVFRKSGQSSLIYVDEVLNTRSKPVEDSLALADELLTRVSEATCFLCILAGSSHGSAIPVQSADTAVSYFEIELFAAALQRKQIHVLVHDSFLPSPMLRSLLDTLRFAFPDWNTIRPLNSEEIVVAAGRIAESSLHIPRETHFMHVRSVAGRIAQALYSARSTNGQRVLFLDGQQIDNGRSPNLALVREILDDVRVRQNQEQRLSRLWLAVRELNTPSIADPDAITLLETALEQWSGAGAWYGLNADLHLGCVAALNSVHVLRERRRAMGATHPNEILYPAGALASAKFNVAKHLTSVFDRRARLKDALKDVAVAISVETEDRSGLLAVRASINRRLGRVFEAASDMEYSLRLRREMGFRDAALGATFSELGFAYLYSFRLRKGLRFCEEGVSRLRDAQATTADLARALRKLAVAYAVNGKPSKARGAHEESQVLAAASNTHDKRQ